MHGAVVPPKTFTGWHRQGFRLFWRRKCRSGRPRIPPDLQRLIRKMAGENPSWGDDRIANELRLKLGLRVSPRTIRKYLPASPARQPATLAAISVGQPFSRIRRRRAWLFNFDKNKAQLKVGHIDFLNAAVGPVIRDGGAIKLLGLASTTGQADFDKRLGEARMHAVLHHLHANFGTKFGLSKEISFGKEMALAFKRANLAGGTGDNVESELWRAVVINAWSRSLPPPPPFGVDVPFNNSTWADDVGKAIDKVNIRRASPLPYFLV